MEGVKVARKTKDKKVKDEFDRMKQAEKKKRRLEKALATSAAIRSELEKKKQKKKEQERMDEEGAAAIAEAVALQVLVGEDSDDSCKIMVKKNGPSSCDFDSNIGFATPEWQPLGYRLDQPMYLHENPGWSFDPYTYGNMWDNMGNSNFMVSSYPYDRDLCHRYQVEEDWGSADIISADHLAAQAVSFLQIADDDYPFGPLLKE